MAQHHRPTRKRRSNPLDGDLYAALRTVRLIFGTDQVTVISLVPRSEAEAERVEGDLAGLVDRVARQVMPYVQAVLELDDEEGGNQ